MEREREEREEREERRVNVVNGAYVDALQAQYYMCMCIHVHVQGPHTCTCMYTMSTCHGVNDYRNACHSLSGGSGWLSPIVPLLGG